jgi:hypothetical protein
MYPYRSRFPPPGIVTGTVVFDCCFYAPDPSRLDQFNPPIIRLWICFQPHHKSGFRLDKSPAQLYFSPGPIDRRQIIRKFELPSSICYDRIFQIDLEDSII